MKIDIIKSKLLFELRCLCGFHGSVLLSVRKKLLNGCKYQKMLVYKSCHIFKKNKNGRFIFWFFWIRSVQNGSNLIKLDQTWSNLIKLDQTWSKWISHKSKNVTIKSCHIYKKDKNVCLIFDFFGSDLSKMDQTGSNWIKMDFSPIKKSCQIYKKDKNGPFIFDFFGSDLSKMDQTWSNLIKMISRQI
jgi:hypothetical protein